MKVTQDILKKCSMDRDMITLVEWAEEKPTVFINFTGLGRSRLICYDGDSLSTWLKQPDKLFCKWEQRNNAPPMDDVGHGGAPNKNIKYIKLYGDREEFIALDVFVKLLQSGQDRLFVEAVYAGSERIGNPQGLFGISMLHGQLPTIPVYKIVSIEKIENFKKKGDGVKLESTISGSAEQYLQDLIERGYVIVNHGFSPGPFSIENITSISANDSDIERLPDLPNITQLYVSNNRLTQLPNIPKIKQLYCSRNNLTNLPNMPEIEILDCGNNKITVLPDMPIITYLKCEHNNLTHLPNLPIVKIIYCSHNKIIELTEYPGVVQIYALNNKISKTADEYPNCDDFSLENNLLTKVPKLPSKIHTINVENNRIETFFGNFSKDSFVLLLGNPLTSQEKVGNAEHKYEGPITIKSQELADFMKEEEHETIWQKGNKYIHFSFDKPKLSAYDVAKITKDWVKIHPKPVE